MLSLVVSSICISFDTKKHIKTILRHYQNMKPLIAFSIILFCFIGCTSTKKSSNTNDVEQLVNLMTGTFNSASQAQKDSAFFDISLQMYPIWQERNDGKWLYVEQAVSAAPQRPYRQRVYKVEKIGSDLYQSVVYTLPNPKRFIGKWNSPNAFNSISPDSLNERTGCTVYLRKISDNYFRGATKYGTCESTLRGASFATSEVEVFENKIVSWDRGFDKNGKQVWGAVKGGYVFDRK
jgi:hypothetical protein